MVCSLDDDWFLWHFHGSLARRYIGIIKVEYHDNIPQICKQKFKKLIFNLSIL